MTVVQVTHYMPPHPGGIERVAATLFDAYRSAGLSVQWIASHVPRDTPRHEAGRTRVACINLLETILDVPVPLWGPGAARQLTAAIRNADIVHVHDCLYPGSALAIRIARQHGRPTILTQHVGFVPYRNAVLNSVEHVAFATMGRRLLSSATHVVLATPAAEAHVSALLRGLPRNSSVIPNGIDLESFRPADAEHRHRARAALDVAPDVPVVLFAGRLVEKKGVPLVLDAARRLPQFQILAIGDGPLVSLMKSAPPNVRWIQSVKPAEMRQYYHAADCFLLPSHGEGLPLVVQEALACGLAAVVSEGEPYARELAAAGVVTLARRDGEALASAVVAACASRVACDSARDYAKQHWDIHVMTRRYIDLLYHIVSTATAAHGRPA